MLRARTAMLLALVACSKRDPSTTSPASTAPAAATPTQTPSANVYVPTAAEPVNCVVVGDKPWMVPDGGKARVVANGWADPYNKDWNDQANEIVRDTARYFAPGTHVRVEHWSGSGHQPEQESVLPFATVTVIDGALKGQSGAMLGRFLAPAPTAPAVPHAP